MHRIERVGWPLVALILVALTIPWFLWGNDRLIAGVPIWLWWHVGWMLLASVVFWLFATRAWGLGIETPASDRDAPGATGRAGDRQ